MAERSRLYVEKCALGLDRKGGWSGMPGSNEAAVTSAVASTSSQKMIGLMRSGCDG